MGRTKEKTSSRSHGRDKRKARRKDMKVNPNVYLKHGLSMDDVSDIITLKLLKKKRARSDE